ncbi:hypothetical protein HFA01_15290 [Halobacillus faecis]|uniref:Uncharacterized protein n=1 Tax=Halobacillus faecis TaxID=360184 RepID=A0A511WQH6_9BACI|nr:hypothetical protein HFA01_15290 [Halobacillus faecis]
MTSPNGDLRTMWILLCELRKPMISLLYPFKVLVLYLLYKVHHSTLAEPCIFNPLFKDLGTNMDLKDLWKFCY